MPRLEASTSTKQATSFDYSDSESYNQGKPASKRQKISSGKDLIWGRGIIASYAH